MSVMKFTCGTSHAAGLAAAVDEACGQVTSALGERRCHLLFVFGSRSYRGNWETAVRRLHERLQPSALLGGTASGVIGGDQEFEGAPALSLLAGHLPEVRLRSFAVSPETLEHASAGGFWMDTIGVIPSEQPNFVLLTDPFTCELPDVLEQLNRTYPNRPIIGGLASGGRAAGDHLLFEHARVVSEGAVGVALSGNVEMEAIVAQSCRPIGRPLVVTSAEENVLLELAGRPALEVLHETLVSLSPTDQKLARSALVVGAVINEMKSRFDCGDFLIRNLVGLDPSIGALAVSEELRIGQTMQFHLRDPKTSQQELRRHLAARSLSGALPAGALMFNCLGRGKSFYGVPHHDARTVRTYSGAYPLGGFFANGEIGPLGGQNLIHSYTASLGLFRPAAVEPSV